ncbi:hypothetical protein TNCV_1442431 [Trichonephila clavipes]|uniref:Uncharacterized protein n=1 Tax=Trichonephila clavipes TaxID=2585209 RepID=A0A8X6V837_TRICX|nr:hypothetical protein TNCV_1442431 [Trichonephila clavipes]
MEARGRPSSVTTDLNTVHLEELIQGDERVGLNEDWLDEGIEETLIRNKVHFRRCCSNSCLELAQWPGT